jgi:hypothetical protein
VLSDPNELISGGCPSALVQPILLLEPAILICAPGANAILILFVDPDRSRPAQLPVNGEYVVTAHYLSLASMAIQRRGLPRTHKSGLVLTIGRACQLGTPRRGEYQHDDVGSHIFQLLIPGRARKTISEKRVNARTPDGRRRVMEDCFASAANVASAAA